MMMEKSLDVYVKLPSGRTSVFQLAKTELVMKIYERIADEERVPVELVQIKYTGKRLNAALTVGYVGICAETILKAEILTVRLFNVYIKLPDGKTLSTQVKNVGTVKDIKEHVKEVEGLEITKQIVKLSGRVLSDDGQKIVDAGITEEAVLQIEEAVEKPPGLKSAADASASLSDADKQAVIESFDASGRSVDVIFSFDTTGSMSSCLNKVRSELSSMVRSLVQRVPAIRIGLIAHGDYYDCGSSYVVKTIDLTSDVDELVRFVKGVSKTSGDDFPECYEWVLRKAQLFDWSENSAKALVVIGDSLPHPPSYTDQRINWHHELEVLTGLGVKVYGVRVMNNRHTEHFYRQLAEVSGGAYVNFSNINVICDMFLAVCYREASDEQYHQFCDEVATRSDMCETTRQDVNDVIRQLDEQTNQMPSRTKFKRYLATDWWDPALDYGTPLYSYNSETDKWSESPSVVHKQTTYDTYDINISADGETVGTRTLSTDLKDTDAVHVKSVLRSGSFPRRKLSIKLPGWRSTRESSTAARASGSKPRSRCMVM